MKHHVILALLSVLFLAACSNNTTQSTPQEQEIPTQKASSGLVIYDKYENLMPRLSTTSDTTYVVNFWATWCAPCVAELPHFMDAAKEYQAAGKKVKFLYVSLDFKRQVDSKLRPFLASGKLDGDVAVLVDPRSQIWIDKISPKWSGSIPATLVFNKDKRAFFEQQFSHDELKNAIDSFLK